jgi:hypothetical protein
MGVRNKSKVLPEELFVTMGNNNSWIRPVQARNMFVTFLHVLREPKFVSDGVNYRKLLVTTPTTWFSIQ